MAEAIADTSEQIPDIKATIRATLTPPVPEAVRADARITAEKYLRELEHGRLSSQNIDLTETPLNPIFDMGPEHAWRVTMEILKRCSLSGYEVDQIRVVSRFIQAAQQPQPEATPIIKVDRFYSEPSGGVVLIKDRALNTRNRVVAEVADPDLAHRILEDLNAKPKPYRAL
jgi:hypothetical protein